MAASPRARAPRRNATATARSQAAPIVESVTASAPPAPAAIPRKPMARTRRISMFQRTVELGLSPTALDVIFDAMRVVSEGQLDGTHYAGSSIITVDLTALHTRLSDVPDAATARRVADLAPADPRVRHQARAIAFAEANRLAAGPLIQPEIDLDVRARGAVVSFALNVEALRRNP